MCEVNGGEIVLIDIWVLGEPHACWKIPIRFKKIWDAVRSLQFGAQGILLEKEVRGW